MKERDTDEPELAQLDENESELAQLRLQAVMAEYQALRAEIRQKFDNHLKLYSFMITAITIMLGYVVVQKTYDLLLAIPIISIALAFRHLWEQALIVMMGDYFKFVESNVLPELLGKRGVTPSVDDDGFWVGWEHYFHRHFPPIPFYQYTIQVLFVFIPVVPALLFSLVIIGQHFLPGEGSVESQLHIIIHMTAVVVYSLSGIFLSRKLWNS